jgi:hypothetical protein
VSEATGIYDLTRERIRRIAISNGCKPQWYEYYSSYVCTCEHGTHYCDSQCSAITLESAKRRAK